MVTKGYIFQDDEKTIIDIDIDMDIVVKKRENEWMLRKTYLYLFSEMFIGKFEILVKCFRRWK